MGGRSGSSGISDGGGEGSIVSNGEVLRQSSEVLNEGWEITLESINPHYGQRGPNNDPRGYTHNCQRCTFAYEMRTRGYDVEATPFMGDDAVTDGWRNAFEGMRYENVGATRKTNIKRHLEDKLREYGNGSRAIVYCAWDGGSAHVFNMGVNADGTIWARDAQTNHSELSNFLDDYIRSMRPTKVMMARVDNLEPSSVYLNGAIRKRQ